MVVDNDKQCIQESEQSCVKNNLESCSGEPCLCLLMFTFFLLSQTSINQSKRPMWLPLHVGSSDESDTSPTGPSSLEGLKVQCARLTSALSFRRWWIAHTQGRTCTLAGVPEKCLGPRCKHTNWKSGKHPSAMKPSRTGRKGQAQRVWVKMWL